MREDMLRMRVKEVYADVEKEYADILEQKEKNIVLLKQQMTKLAKELEKERDSKDKFIKEAVEKVRKQRSDDLKMFIEKKREIVENLENKTLEELKKHKE